MGARQADDGAVEVHRAGPRETPFAKAKNYNNYYEFGDDKGDPANNAHTLKTRPWTVKFEGLVKKKQTVNIDNIMNYRPIESACTGFAA